MLDKTSSVRNKPILKSNQLGSNLNNWINEEEVHKLVQNSLKVNRLTKGNGMLQTLKKLFDQDMKLVKEHLLNKFTENFNEIDKTYLMIKEILIRTPNDNVPIHTNYHVGLPINICLINSKDYSNKTGLSITK